MIKRTKNNVLSHTNAAALFLSGSILLAVSVCSLVPPVTACAVESIPSEETQLESAAYEELQKTETTPRSAWIEEQKEQLRDAMDLLRDYGISPMNAVRELCLLITGEESIHVDTDAPEEFVDSVQNQISNAGSSIAEDVADTIHDAAEEQAESFWQKIKEKIMEYFS